jgi:peptidoglycan/xylan/chitin deacetylase (PgdA/CDA1 family)
MRLLSTYLRSVARWVWVQALAWTGCLRRAEEALRENGAILTLTLHRVLDDTAYQETNSLPGIILRQRTFAELVEYLTEHFEPVALADSAPGAVSRRLQVAVTFDDGWQDNYTTVFPIVRHRKLPVTIFVCPALVGQREPFWPEQTVALLRARQSGVSPIKFAPTIDRLKQTSQDQRARFLNKLQELNQAQAVKVRSSEVDRTLSWEEIAEMERSGVCFGSHTNTHQIMPRIAAEVARRELSQSKSTLERVIGKPCGHFAYPNGDWSAEAQRLVGEAGFSKAATTEPGAWVCASDALAIPRMNVSEDNVVGPSGRFSPTMFRYAVVWKAWRAARRRLIAQSASPRTRTKLCTGN